MTTCTNMDDRAKYTSATATTTAAASSSSVTGLTAAMGGMSLDRHAPTPAADTSKTKAVVSEIFATLGKQLAENIVLLSKDSKHVGTDVGTITKNEQLFIHFSFEKILYAAWKAFKGSSDLYIGIQEAKAYADRSKTTAIITISLHGDRHVSMGGAEITEALLSKWRPIVENAVSQTSAAVTAMKADTDRTVVAAAAPSTGNQKNPPVTAPTAAPQVVTAAAAAPTALPTDQRTKPTVDAPAAAPQVVTASPVVAAASSPIAPDQLQRLQATAKIRFDALSKAFEAIPTNDSSLFSEDLVLALKNVLLALDIFAKSGNLHAHFDPLHSKKQHSVQQPTTVVETFQNALKPGTRGEINQAIRRAQEIMVDATAKLKHLQGPTRKHDSDRKRVSKQVLAACQSTRAFLEKLPTLT